MGVKALLHHRAAPYVLALAVQLALAPWLVHDWDGHVFLRSAEDFLAGTTPYETAEAASSQIYLDDHWPPVNTWWAYPPLMLLLYAPLVGLAKLASSDPALARLAMKIPFILGNLALAYVGGRLVHRLATGDKDAARRRAEWLLLLNPFLIFMAAAWGMFDATLMALLLLSVLLLDQRRPAAAGLAFGLATLVKVFPLFVAPLFALHAWKRWGARAALTFTGAAAGIFTLVCLPFLLRSPQGFVNQVVLMHLERGPQGFALVSFPLQLRNLNNLFGWSIPIAPEAVVVAVAGALLWITLALVHLRWRGAMDARGLLRTTLLAFLAILLVNKVVNEQYFVMPLALLCVLVALGATDGERRAHRAYTWGGAVSAVLIGLHFLTFVPADIILIEPDIIMDEAARATGLPVIVLFSLPHAVAILALVPALVATLRLVVPEMRESVLHLAAIVGRLGARAAHAPAARATVVLLLLLPPVATGVLAMPAPEEEPSPLGSRVVFARYDLALTNPLHDPETRAGQWARFDAPMPEEGYYRVTPRKLGDDLARLRDAGVDVVIAGHATGSALRLETFLDAARAHGLRAAPAIDLGDLSRCPDSQRWRPANVPEDETPTSDITAKLVASCVRTALRPFRDHPATLQVDGRPVLFALNASGLRESDLSLDAWAERALGASGAYVVTSKNAEDEDARAYPWADAALVPGAATPRIASVRSATWERDWDAAHEQAAAWILLSWNLHRERDALEPLADGSNGGLLDSLPAHKRRLEGGS